MTTSLIKMFTKAIHDGLQYDVAYNPRTDTSAGFKLSLQGKSTSDSVLLLESLAEFLIENMVPFKSATSKRFKLQQTEQAFKAMTIYVPSHVNHLELAELVYAKISTYKGWQDIQTPTSYEHYAGAIYLRNDRDEFGSYVKAN